MYMFSSWFQRFHGTDFVWNIPDERACVWIKSHAPATCMYLVIKTRYERNSACTNTHSNMFSSFGDKIYGWTDTHDIFQISFCFMCCIHGNDINSAVAPP